MAYLGSWKIDDVLYFYANTTRFDTGVATDADSDPAYRVYENETGTAILTGVMALLDSGNTNGFYSEAITLSAANGFEKGKQYVIHKKAAVNSVSGEAHDTFQIEAEVDANVVSDKTDYVLTSAYDSAKTAAQDSDMDLVVPQTNKLSFDSDNYIIADGRKISASATAADNVETNIPNLNATVSSRSSHSAADVWAVGGRTLTSFGTLVADIIAAILLVINVSGGIVESNVKEINDTEITGNGSGTPWGPA